MGKFKSGGNPYHDPKTGRFTTAEGAGAVFDKKAYAKAKKKGYNPDFPNQITTGELAARMRDRSTGRHPISGRRLTNRRRGR